MLYSSVRPYVCVFEGWLVMLELNRLCRGGVSLLIRRGWPCVLSRCILDVELCVKCVMVLVM